MGNAITWLALLLYLLAAVGYASDGEWWKSVYFVGAFIVTLAVLKM